MKRKANGGAAEGSEKGFGEPVDDAEKDVDKKNQRYTYQSKVNDEAEEKKRGGRAKRKRGGSVTHHESGEPMKHAKNIGPVQGKVHAHSGNRAGRASGGRTGSNFSPFSSARAGTPPRDHKVVKSLT